MVTPYDRNARLLLVISVVGVALTWHEADRICVAGCDMTGWLVGIAGLSLPWVMLSCYALWLRRERHKGNALATVPWLPLAIVLSCIFWMVFLLFPFM